ncbi:hypothetical protein C7974DRAFT_139684 [Boeremia exigua]|uniref:uncharacterized protein n=1 Tax=Boeremia exigua TaxID=749465 RepID=UPI001E8D47F2|nr:uncharacterized protein C7974DRAFT_139684 [Boeremia exigua]KAH6639852.1 hypothetical protein C7974DRAFT_139684 [Boeremia exigua]
MRGAVSLLFSETWLWMRGRVVLDAPLWMRLHALRSILSFSSSSYSSAPPPYAHSNACLRTRVFTQQRRESTLPDAESAVKGVCGHVQEYGLPLDRCLARRAEHP